MPQLAHIPDVSSWVAGVLVLLLLVVLPLGLAVRSTPSSTSGRRE